MIHLVFWVERDREELPGRIKIRGSPGEPESSMTEGRMIEEDVEIEGKETTGEEIETTGEEIESKGEIETTGEEIEMIGETEM